MAEDLTERVAEILSDEATTTEKIAESLGVSKSAASKAVRKLREAGRARTQRGRPEFGGGVYAASQ